MRNCEYAIATSYSIPTLQLETGEISGIFRFHVRSVREFLNNRVDVVAQVQA